MQLMARWWTLLVSDPSAQKNRRRTEWLEWFAYPIFHFNHVIHIELEDMGKDTGKSWQKLQDGQDNFLPCCHLSCRTGFVEMYFSHGHGSKCQEKSALQRSAKTNCQKMLDCLFWPPHKKGKTVCLTRLCLETKETRGLFRKIRWLSWNFRVG